MLRYGGCHVPWTRDVHVCTQTWYHTELKNQGSVDSGRGEGAMDGKASLLRGSPHVRVLSCPPWAEIRSLGSKEDLSDVIACICWYPTRAPWRATWSQGRAGNGASQINRRSPPPHTHLARPVPLTCLAGPCGHNPCLVTLPGAAAEWPRGLKPEIGHPHVVAHRSVTRPELGHLSLAVGHLNPLHLTVCRLLFPIRRSLS